MPITAMDLVTKAKKSITEISISDVKKSNALVLDVREPTEFAAGSLPNAINIPRGVLEFQITNHPHFLNQQITPIIVYCQSGGRSALATETLQSLGYTSTVSMAGGYNAWTAQ